MKRGWIQGCSFVVAALLALQVLPWREAARILPSISPLLNGLGALALRSAHGWLWLGIPVCLLGWWRPRWFCRYLCPVGFASERAGRLRRGGRGRFARWPNLGRWILLAMVGGALAGCPLVLWLDPLAIFNGFFSAWRIPWTREALGMAMGFPAILLISWIFPNAWCHRLCPLGAAQDLLVLARRGLRSQKTPVESRTFQTPISRRALLGIAAGGAAGMAFRWKATSAVLPVRPPGARPEAEFKGLCARCGACVRACSYGILRPDLGQCGWSGLLAPVVGYSSAHCFEYCNDCTQVCPTGAIESLTLESKRHRAMGLAEVAPEKCIAWHDRQSCMVCQEFCPYLAIDAVTHRGVHCPVVKAEMCRGCGACQVNCPALPDKAIVVKGIPQRAARPVQD